MLFILDTCRHVLCLKTSQRFHNVGVFVQPETRSSIFGGAKPVDTLSKELEIEQKLQKQHVAPPVQESRSSSIFGGAKPVDTAVREREIEARLRGGQDGSASDKR